jgi:hypothetical protein
MNPPLPFVKPMKLTQLSLNKNGYMDKALVDNPDVNEVINFSLNHQRPFFLSVSSGDCTCVLDLTAKTCHAAFKYVNLKPIIGNDILLMAITDNKVLKSFEEGLCARKCLRMKKATEASYCDKKTSFQPISMAKKQFPNFLKLVSEKRVVKRPRPSDSPTVTIEAPPVKKARVTPISPPSPPLTKVTIITPPSNDDHNLDVDPKDLGKGWDELNDAPSPPVHVPIEAYPTVPRRQEIVVRSRPHEMVKFDFTPFITHDSTIRVNVSPGPPEFVYLNSTASTGIGFSKFFREPLADDLPTTAMHAIVDQFVPSASNQNLDEPPCPVWKAVLNMTHDPILGPCHIRRFPASMQSIDILLGERGVLFINGPDKSYRWWASIQPHATRDIKTQVPRLSVWTSPTHTPRTGDSSVQASNITRIRFDGVNGLAVGGPLHLRILVIPTSDSFVEAILVQGDQLPGPLVKTYEDAVSDLRQYNMVRRDYERMRSKENLLGVGSYLTMLAQVGLSDRDGQSFGPLLTREQLAYAMFKAIRRITVDDTHITFEMPLPCVSTLLQIRRKSGRIYFICGIYVAYIRMRDIKDGDPPFHIYSPGQADEGYDYWVEYLDLSKTYATSYDNPTLQYTLTSKMADLANGLFGPMVQYRVVDVSEWRQLRFFLSKSSTEVAPVPDV